MTEFRQCVGAIGFGAMALSFRERPSEDDAIRLIHTVLDQGVNLIDTADVYAPAENEVGHSERLIAKAIGSWSGARDRIVVATKGGYTRQSGKLIPNGRPEHLRLACERSLRALGVSAIDLYQLHIPDPNVPLAESVGALRTLRDEGKVRWIGLSNVTLTAIETARAIAPIQTVQNELSFVHRDVLTVGPIARLERRGVRGVRQLRRFVGEPFQSGVADLCERTGIALLAYSPLGGSRRKLISENAALGAIARSRGVSPFAVAMAWLLGQSSGINPIPSARSVAHALDTLGGVSLSLTATERATLDAGLR